PHGRAQPGSIAVRPVGSGKTSIPTGGRGAAAGPRLPKRRRAVAQWCSYFSGDEDSRGRARGGILWSTSEPRMAGHTAQTPPPYASETLLRLAPPETPEDRLMLAVLLDGVALLREHATGVRPHRQRVVSDTARWFASDDDGWALSFANICL